MRGIIKKSCHGKRGRKTKAESDYIARAVEFGCMLTYYKTGISGTPAIWHHRRTGTGAGLISSHEDGVALAPHFHDNGREALHSMGRKAWEKHHEITELELIAMSKKMFDL